MNTNYLRPLKSERAHRIYNSIEWKENLAITTLHNVLVTPLGQLNRPFPDVGGYIAVDDNDFCASVRDVCDCGSIAKEAVRLDGKTLFCGILRKIWGHFLLNPIGRLWPLANGKSPEDYDHFLFIADEDFQDDILLKGNYFEFFRLLGLTESGKISPKVVVVRKPVAAETLDLPDLGYEHDRFVTEETRNLLAMIRENALRGFTLKRADRRIFLTRSRLKNALRNEINIKAIDKFFSDNGFEIISPELYNLTDFIRLLAESEKIASISGSTAHNFIFAPADQDRQFIVIDRHAFINRFQLSIDRMLGIETTYVDAAWMPRASTSEGFVFLYDFTPEFIRFATDEGYCFRPLDSSRQKAKMLRQFFNRYKRYYGESEALREYEIDQGDLYSESMVATREYFPKWLIHHHALLPHDYLSPRILYRTYIKR